ncbi:protein draper-like [Spodoptera litura]|uniref:Protein draper-like n=1 Tax=Spodoptera litura TaxID=69820 RepID=A0A9J7E7F0_SPOLT|nr:protein draper-like [Spodoptera litura]
MKMRVKCNPVIFLCAVAYFVAELDAQICQRVQLVTRMVQVTYKTSYRITYHGRCYYDCILTKWVSSIERKSIPKRELKPTNFCCTGYIRKDDSANDSDIVCEPICMPACRNGRCKTPGQCECNHGYTQDPEDDHNCLPSCRKGCQNGTCVGPETCRCNFGYTLVNGTCQPVCTDPCHNGTCVAPEKCECLVGYRKSENNICQPYCSHGCDNGACVAPETCQCHSGWDLKETKHFPYKHCVPICSKPCGNEVCVAPDTCGCLPSYKKSEGGCEPICFGGWVSKNGRCVAQCSHPCGNGTCVAPNVCACHSGYHMDINYTFLYSSNPNATICVPTCTGCAGRCVAPNKCELGLTSESQISFDDYYYDYDPPIFPRHEKTTTSTTRRTTTTTTTSTATPHPIPTTTTTTMSTPTRHPVPTTTSTTTATSASPYFNETKGEELKSSWIEENWVQLFVPILLIITAAIITLLLLVWRCTPIRTIFKGRSYVVEGDPVQTGNPSPLEDVQISDIKI